MTNPRSSMFVKNMFADEWFNRTDQGIEIANPTWPQIRNAIEEIDGIRKTLVTISDRHDSGHYMIVSGKWNGRCLVNTTKDNLAFFSLVDSTLTTNKILLFVGGQDGDYEERKCVPIDWALKAARRFV